MYDDIVIFFVQVHVYNYYMYANMVQCVSCAGLAGACCTYSILPQYLICTREELCMYDDDNSS